MITPEHIDKAWELTIIDQAIGILKKNHPVKSRTPGEIRRVIGVLEEEKGIIWARELRDSPPVDQEEES
jgi:hypothetical protein